MARRNKGLSVSQGLSASIYGKLKLAKLFEMNEKDFEDEISKIEGSPLFSKLKSLGVITAVKSGNLIESTKRFEGISLRSGQTSRAALESDSEISCLIRKIGEENFKKYFLGETGFSNEQTASDCDIKPKEVAEIKAFVNTMFIQSEFEQEKAPLPEKFYSFVGAIKIENGKPAIAFFHRDVWKNIYKIDGFKLRKFESSLYPAERGKISVFLKKIGFIEKRKTTLYKLLEVLIVKQKKYLMSGNPLDLNPVSQKETAGALEIDESVLSRMISNKSIEMPWNMEVKLKDLLASKKRVNKEKLYGLLEENPNVSDEALGKKMTELFGVRLSRRSINQYRNEINADKTK